MTDHWQALWNKLWKVHILGSRCFCKTIEPTLIPRHCPVSSLPESAAGVKSLGAELREVATGSCRENSLHFYKRVLITSEDFLIVQVISPSPVPKSVQGDGGLLDTHAVCPILGWLWAGRVTQVWSQLVQIAPPWRVIFWVQELVQALPSWIEYFWVMNTEAMILNVASYEVNQKGKQKFQLMTLESRENSRKIIPHFLLSLHSRKLRSDSSCTGVVKKSTCSELLPGMGHRVPGTLNAHHPYIMACL